MVDFRLNGRALVLTDVDDTLLPLSGDVSVEELAKLGVFLKKLRSLGVEVVPVTFETLKQLKSLEVLLDFDFMALIAEGGCLIQAVRGLLKSSMVEEADAYGFIELCNPIACFEDVLAKIERDQRCSDRLLRLSRADPAAVSKALMVPLKVVMEARVRRYSEVYITFDGPCKDLVVESVGRAGLQAIRTRRAVHVLGSSKGRAVDLFLKSMNMPGRYLATIGIGDNEADADFLLRTDIPAVLSSDGSSWFKRAPYLRGSGSPPGSWIALVRYALGTMGIHA